MTPNYREFRTTVGGKEVIIETGKYAEPVSYKHMKLPPT